MNMGNAVRVMAILVMGMFIGTVMMTLPANADVTSDLVHLYSHLNKVYVRKVAKPGTVMTGIFSERYVANSGFTLVHGSYPSRLKVGTPSPTVEFVQGNAFTETCPGLGQAASGTLCIYGFNIENIYRIQISGMYPEETLNYGFSLDVFPTYSNQSGYILGAWAYTVPPVPASKASGIEQSQPEGIGTR